MSNEIQLSIICPTIQGIGRLLNTYNTIRTNLNIEFIFLGPVDYVTGNPAFNHPYKFIVTKVKPTQCCAIGMNIASSELLGWMADDQEFSPYAWDEAYRIYKEANDYKAIVSLDWWERGVTYKNKVVLRDIQLPTSDSIMSKKFFIELGGYDRRFIKRNMERDLFLRAVKNGAKVYWCSSEFRVTESAENENVTQHLYEIDSTLCDMKWEVINGELIQKIPDELFEINDSIYSIDQGGSA